MIENPNNLSKQFYDQNIFYDQTQAKYYLVGPKIILVALYSIFLPMIN